MVQLRTLRKSWQINLDSIDRCVCSKEGDQDYLRIGEGTEALTLSYADEYASWHANRERLTRGAPRRLEINRAGRIRAFREDDLVLEIRPSDEIECWEITSPTQGLLLVSAMGGDVGDFMNPSRKMPDWISFE
jgi:hypothetical protein